MTSTRNGIEGALLFDFDGTLVDASEAIYEAFSGVLRENALPVLTRTQVAAMVGLPLRDMFGQVQRQASSQQIECYVQQYRRLFFPISRGRSRLLPGSREVLAHFSSRRKLAIATSRRSDGALHILDGYGLSHFFSAVVGSEQVKRLKPDPEAIVLALEHLEVDSGVAVMVGDTTHDVAAGTAAGVLTVGVTTGPFGRSELQAAGATWVIDSLSELVDLL